MTEQFKIGSIVANRHSGTLGLVLKTLENHDLLSSRIFWGGEVKWVWNTELELIYEVSDDD